VTPPSSRRTPSPAAADRLGELHERLAREVAALRTGEDWQRWLKTASRFHSYSFQNTLLILSQRPDATSVAGYEAWKALGRQVARGEKGIAILAPVLRRLSPTAPSDSAPPDAEPALTGAPARRALAGFRVTYVWDISQTTGPPLPEPPTPQLLQGQAPPGLWDALADVVTGHGFRLDRGPAGGANGITDFGARTVRVRADVDDAQAVKTLAHELGHVRLHDPATAPTAWQGQLACLGLIEVEAESVAYLVTAAHGLDAAGYTFPYVAGWADSVPGHTPEDVVRLTGERVLTAARSILAATETAPTDTPALVADAPRATARPPAPDPAHDALLAVQAKAAAFFREHLDHSWVPPYLHGRRLDAALDTPWDAGRAPAGWTTLVHHLRDHGVDDDTLLASGLAIRARTGRLIDTFRERLMLPIRDDDGHVIGFVGRAHPDASHRTPKYLNTHTTALYAKGKHLYGVHQNLPALQAGTVPVLVEGPLDAVAVTTALSGRGVGIAVCGSVLNIAHVDHLARHTDLAGRGVVVGFDTDPAGHNAATWAATLFTGRAIRARGAEWAPSSDPASLFQQRGAAEVERRVLDEAGPLTDLIVDRRLSRWEPHLHVPEGRVGAARAVASLLAPLPDADVTRQAHRTAKRLCLDTRVVTDEVARLRSSPLAETLGSPQLAAPTRPATPSLDLPMRRRSR